MALTENEGTKKEVLDLIPSAGFPAGYVNLMRIYIDADSNFSGELRRYFSEVERQANPNAHPGLVAFGGAIPAAVKNQVFSLLYPYIAAQIELINLIEQKNLEKWTEEDYNEKVQELYGSYEIENPYAPKDAQDKGAIK